jgi:hypothetical protein
MKYTSEETEEKNTEVSVVQEEEEKFVEQGFPVLGFGALAHCVGVRI